MLRLLQSTITKIFLLWFYKQFGYITCFRDKQTKAGRDSSRKSPAIAPPINWLTSKLHQCSLLPQRHKLQALAFSGSFLFTCQSLWPNLKVLPVPGASTVPATEQTPDHYLPNELRDTVMASQGQAGWSSLFRTTQLTSGRPHIPTPSCLLGSNSRHSSFSPHL